MTVVGWYVHHHGAGHLTRFLAVRPHLDAEVAVLSSLPAPAVLPSRTTWTVLPRDDEPSVRPDGTVRLPQDSSPTASGLLHWAPLRHAGHTARLAAIAQCIAERDPTAFVVDVSAEVTLFVRLLGVPIVLMTQPGERTDEPHALAFRAAERIVAPWPDGVHPAGPLDAVRGAVRWVGGVSRYDGRGDSDVEPGHVVVLGAASAGQVAAAAAATPTARWTTLGGPGGVWADEPWEFLRRAEIVVSAAGQNSVADLAAVGARAVIVAQDRPFGEQAATARALASAGLAIVVDAWPEAEDWPALLERARELRPEWERWQTAGAARRAADVIAEVAE